MKDLKDVTILVVDDEEELRDAILYDFKKKGFQLLGAGNGKEAFEIIKNNHVDIVITDVKMPQGNGIELLDQIKMRSPKTPVVMFLTGYFDLTLEDAFDKGADAVLSKPFDRKELMAAVMSSILAREQLWGEKKEVFNLSELKLANPPQCLSIGRGGFFIALSENLPHVGSKVSFNFKLDKENISHLSGYGNVRWVRTRAQEHHPMGCGIEFEYLDDCIRIQVIEYIDRLNSRSYIPKS